MYMLKLSRVFLYFHENEFPEYLQIPVYFLSLQEPDLLYQALLELINYGLFADINDSTTIKFAEDGTAYIDLSDGKEPAPLSGETPRRIYRNLIFHLLQLLYFLP